MSFSICSSRASRITRSPCTSSPTSKSTAAGIAATASPVALANVAYVLAKLKDKAYAAGKLRELRTLIRVSPLRHLQDLCSRFAEPQRRRLQ